jgi:hypothetical protein
MENFWMGFEKRANAVATIAGAIPSALKSVGSGAGRLISSGAAGAAVKPGLSVGKKMAISAGAGAVGGYAMSGNSQQPR